MMVVERGTAAEDAPPEPRGSGARSVIAGRYEVDLSAPLGAGGMAVVYRGRDLRTRRDVALKTLREEYRQDADARARFRREVRAIAFAAHPNVVRVFDLCEEQSAPWAVLEYIPGSTLKDVIAERGPLAPEAVVPILDQTAGALAHLHGRGFVHLDVKPQNLLVTEDGTIKLIDFGLAQNAGTIQELINGTTFGTAAYLAPEQACGEAVAAATDVYSLGCVVYELLTGAPPFPGRGAGRDAPVKNAVVRMHVNDQPMPPTRARPDLNLPAWVDDAVLWALAKRPAERYHDARSFAQVFRAGVADGVVTKPEATRPLAVQVFDTTKTNAALPSRNDQGEAGAPTPVGARPIGRLYRFGGRTARRSAPLRAALWRLAFVLAVGNLLLGLVLFAQRGTPGVLASAATLHPGGEARAVVAGLRVRASPGTDEPVLAVLESGDRIAITDAKVMIDNDAWWPVEDEVDGERVSGFVWGKGIEPIAPNDPREWARYLLHQGDALIERVTDR